MTIDLDELNLRETWLLARRQHLHDPSWISYARQLRAYDVYIATKAPTPAIHDVRRAIREALK